MMHSEVGDIINSLKIKKYISKKINNNFESKVMESSIKENYSNPCFFIYLENSEIHSKNNNQDEITVEVLVQYQNKKAKEYELNQINEKLRSLFNYVQMIDGTRVLITEMYSTIDDFNLYLNFDVSYRQDKLKEKGNHDVMRELKIEVK